MRIALLAHGHHRIAEPYAGGLEMHTALVATELVRRGHAVTLFARAGSRTAAVPAPLLRAEAEWTPLVERRYDAAVAGVLAGLDSDAYDVVLNNSLSPAPYAYRGPVPVLTVLHTPATLPAVTAVVTAPDWRPPPRQRWVAVSRTTRRDWLRLLPAVAWVPNGIVLAHWAARRPARPAPDLAVWSGRITPEKGLALAIDAARVAGLRLHVSGPIADPAYFAAEIAPRLGDGVRYVGHLDHRRLPGFLRSGRVCLFTPLWAEPFGLAAVEAMAAGTPVAALPWGAVDEVVAPAGGVVAATSSAAALAAAALRAADLDRGDVARSVRRFSARAMVDAYEALLDRTANRRTETPVTTTPMITS